MGVKHLRRSVCLHTWKCFIPHCKLLEAIRKSEVLTAREWPLNSDSRGRLRGKNVGGRMWQARWSIFILHQKIRTKGTNFSTDGVGGAGIYGSKQPTTCEAWETEKGQSSELLGMCLLIHVLCKYIETGSWCKLGSCTGNKEHGH